MTEPLALSPLPDLLIEPVVRAALAEDLGRGGDLTSALIEPEARMACVFVARRDGRVAGLDCARLALTALDPSARFEIAIPDGQDASAGAVLARVEGYARALLTAERTGLNLLGRLSGVATLTRAYVQAVEGTGARIADTRKTTPGLRALEKYAVRCGGGVNHRFGLDDAILIKDNHVAACGSVRAAVERARAGAPHGLRIEVECDRIEQVREAIDAGADVILLDNMDAAAVRRACRLVAGRARIEVSGGVSLATVRGLAEAGANLISVGSLTHSVRAIDIGLDFPPVERRRGGGPRARR